MFNNQTTISISSSSYRTKFSRSDMSFDKYSISILRITFKHTAFIISRAQFLNFSTILIWIRFEVMCEVQLAWLGISKITCKIRNQDPEMMNGDVWLILEHLNYCAVSIMLCRHLISGRFLASFDSSWLMLVDQAIVIGTWKFSLAAFDDIPGSIVYRLYTIYRYNFLYKPLDYYISMMCIRVIVTLV